MTMWILEGPKKVVHCCDRFYHILSGLGGEPSSCTGAGLKPLWKSDTATWLRLKDKNATKGAILQTVAQLRDEAQGLVHTHVTLMFDPKVRQIETTQFQWQALLGNVPALDPWHGRIEPQRLQLRTWQPFCYAYWLGSSQAQIYWLARGHKMKIGPWRKTSRETCKFKVQHVQQAAVCMNRLHLV